MRHWTRSALLRYNISDFFSSLLEAVGFVGWGRALLVLWPTSVFMMSAEAGGGAFGVLLALMESAFANAIVYALVGSLVSFCYRRFFSRAT
jgi:hypothetical protein